jgi:serine/threonine protein kinase
VIPKISTVSNDCKEIVRKMLEKKPEKRITIREIMQHKWIARYKEKKLI